MNDFVIERDNDDNKVRRELTDGEQATKDTPPSPAEIEAELDQIADGLLTNDRATKALARFVFDMWGLLSAQDPSTYPPMTPTQFRRQIKNRM